MPQASRSPSSEGTSRVRILENEETSLLFSDSQPLNTTRTGRPEKAVYPEASPQDGGNFRKSLQIDMKGLVGDAVGNMSISPASRDVVLAARRGLFIIDLEAPLEVPRFMPQGGTWDVADVQWNPHSSRAEYIVSTSSEKLLIWNLVMVGKTSIEHILHSHYRAITDINWHTTERDTVVSTGIDSWIWAWDLREPRKPIFGLSAFNSGGTHVKWNRQDPNILASSHANQVLIWDRRKGSLPIAKINAHTSKIYGIDWSHHASNEIVTCSLDKTIKVWDTQNLSASEERSRPESQLTIMTAYPVWRARNLPFGRGVLSLAQRGETALEMYAHSSPRTPVEIFEGHTDVVKEFVWRKNGQETEFQMITWSKDRTLRFWPVDTDTMHKVGYNPPTVPRGRASRSVSAEHPSISYRNPPHPLDHDMPLFSAPVGSRGILAEVRAGLPPARQLQTPMTPSVPNKALDNPPGPPPTRPIRMSSMKGGTMSRGNMGSKSLSKVDALSWLSSVKVGEGRRGSNSAAGSGERSADASRLSSRSRAGSESHAPAVFSPRKRSESRDERKDGDSSQSLQDEITSVLNKLATSKIKLEKHDLMKKRTCTLGFHGPWGESSLSVFLRITFTFPRDYPHSASPDGTPTVELERNTLIPLKTRASILRRLRTIRETRRPCLEACLRFLLSGTDEKVGASLDSESSSDEEANPTKRKSKEPTVSMLRNHKNLTEPRTSQGCFGPNDELVYFFRAPPRIMRNYNIHTNSESSSVKFAETPRSNGVEGNQPQPPSLVSDAVRRLGLAATDRSMRPDPVRQPEADQIFKLMTNIFTASRNIANSTSSTSYKSISEGPAKAYTRLPRANAIVITHTTEITGADKKVASRYLFSMPQSSIADVCVHNAEVAKAYGRFDHERVFLTLAAAFPAMREGCDGNQAGFSRIEKRIIDCLHTEFQANKDIQMLAMLAVIVLQASHHLLSTSSPILSPTSLHMRTPRSTSTDYFSISRSPISPATSGIPWRFTANVTPPLPQLSTGPSMSSSISSRGSWSSLFNPGTVKHFMTGVGESIKDGLITPLEIPISTPRGSIPVPQYVKTVHGTSPIDSPLKPSFRSTWKGVGSNGSGSVGSPHPISSSSWSEINSSGPLSPVARRRPSLTYRRNSAMTILQDRRPVLTARTNTIISNPPPAAQGKSKKNITFIPEPQHEQPISFTPQELGQFTRYVYVYAEMLFSWQLYHKRLEILKASNITSSKDPDEHQIGLTRQCPRCKYILPQGKTSCPSCAFTCGLAPPCSVCRVLVRGLSQTCPDCLHVSHLSCWRAIRTETQFCPAGCGCQCSRLPSSPRKALSFGVSE